MSFDNFPSSKDVSLNNHNLYFKNYVVNSLGLKNNSAPLMCITVCNYKCSFKSSEQDLYCRMERRSWTLVAFFSFFS